MANTNLSTITEYSAAGVQNTSATINLSLADELAGEQQAACQSPAAIDAIPSTVQALFLDGGDQWLHWHTFYTADGQPNPWLNAIRTAFASGELVVAGTSAGAAVQSGATGMISNGTSANALARGATRAASDSSSGIVRKN